MALAWVRLTMKTSAPCSTRPKTAARAAPPAPTTAMRAPFSFSRFSSGRTTPATSVLKPTMRPSPPIRRVLQAPMRAVSGSELYDVTVTIKETPKAQWRSICADCAGGIDSLVELLQGRLSKGVMERLCRQQGGLFPRPSDIRFSCTCPDHALMCKHVAAVLYGIGARLDLQPELLFRLRAVDETDLVVHVDAALPMSKQRPAAGRVLATDDVSALFGLDMAASEGVASAANTPVSGPARSKRASAGMPPGKPAQTKTATVARKGPVNLVVPKRISAAAKATPPKWAMTAKATVTKSAC